MVYLPFIKLCYRTCQSAAIIQGNFVRIKVLLEIATICIIGVSFMLEVVNLLDYIQGTRLALINYSPWVAALLILMCLTRRKPCSFKKLLIIFFSFVTLLQMELFHPSVDRSNRRFQKRNSNLNRSRSNDSRIGNDFDHIDT